MKDKIAAAVLGSLITALVFWALGVIGSSAAEIPVPRFAVLAFNQSACPQGWRTFDPGRGRYIVGMTKDGQLGAVVGTELKDKENRPAGRHVHGYMDSAAGAKGQKFDFGGNLNHSEDKKTTEANDGVEGTNAPYVQLLLCEKT